MDKTDILSLMRKRLSMANTALNESRTSQLDDLRFLAGSPDNQWQWPSDVLMTRGAVQGQAINARPCLTINKLPQHVKQVTNDQRQNRPSGKVIPVDDKADIKVAEILDGIIRHIEYISDADVAYDTACESQVATGEGYIRLLTDYCDDSSFDQDIKIGRIRNQFSVYMDPMIQDPCGSDAEWCIVSDEILKEEFESLYPKAQALSSFQNQGMGDPGIAWISETTVRIAEYFFVEHSDIKINLYPGNLSYPADSPEAGELDRIGLLPIRSRTADQRTVRWIKTNGYEILEEKEWPGRWIPIVRVIGNEFEVDGKIYLSGLVRNAKDAQRMYNYWTSQEAEMLALAPKAPFIGYGGQFEGYETQWKTANITNWPYLEVNPDVTDGAGAALPLPQRALPPMAQNGLIQAKMGASDDIKSVTGQYDASLGNQSNEKSGKAILARERQTDTGTYHFVDNLARAIRHITRQIVDLIPKIYDTERVARIIGIDGETDHAKINPEQPEAVKEIKENDIVIERIYNLGIGKYDVCVTTGPSYMTKKQEAMEAMSLLLQGNPQLWSVAGDLFIKSMDWPGAEEMAKRFRNTIDPKILGDDDNPEMAQAQQHIQTLEQELQQAMQMLQNASKSMEAKELALKEREVEIKAYDAETKRLSSVSQSLSPDQVQDIVLGTVHSMMDAGDLGELPEREDVEIEEPEQEPIQ